MIKKSLPFVIVIIFLAAGFLLLGSEERTDIKVDKETETEINKGSATIKVAGQVIKVDLALTSEEQEQGLSGKKGLKPDEGMLFVFEQPGRYSFWMKDMNFPIDIIWLAPSDVEGIMKVIYIKKDARPESYPEVYGPAVDTKYVLEVVSGFSEKNNLKTGDTVEFL